MKENWRDHLDDKSKPWAYGNTNPEKYNKKHELLWMARYSVESSSNQLIKRGIFKTEKSKNESRQAKDKYHKAKNEHSGFYL